jgi:tripartite-type tricarboxylate transporter receptor subunit TctC
MRQGLCLLAFLAAVAVPANRATTQDWPTKPVHLIVSQAAGGTPDIICRLLTERLSHQLAQPFVVENRPGGANIVGAQTAAHAVPDGYTFFFATAAALVSNPYTFKSLPYDPANDFVPVGMVAKNPFFILAHPSVRASTLTELIALEKSDPGKLAYATDGPRNFSGILAAWINKLAGIGILQVPYAMMPQGIQDAIAGRVQLVILAPASAEPFINRGSLRAIAVSSAKRVPGYENVPAISETLPGIELTGWFAIVAPKGTPASVIDRLNSELDRILKDPSVVEKLASLGSYTEGAGTLMETHGYLRTQLETWGKVVRDIGLEPE